MNCRSMPLLSVNNGSSITRWTLFTRTYLSIPVESLKLIMSIIRFHWGDIEDDGKFRAHVGIIDEARAVMRESFERQQFKYDGVIIR